MKLQAYLGSLLPGFTKERMVEDIGTAREELRDSTIEPLRAITRLYGKYKWESEWVRELDESFEKEVKIRYTGNFLNGMLDVMETIDDNIDTVEQLVETQYADDVMRDAMTVLRVNLLQYIEVMTFAIQYTRRLLVAVMAIEVSAVNGNDPESLPKKGDMDWLEQRRSSYFVALQILSDKKENIQKTFSEMPNVAINKDSVDTTQAVIGHANTDPMGFCLIPLVLNPIYHVRMAIAEWQAARFKAAEEEKRMLEFRLLQLKLAKEGKGKKDAKLEQNIEHTQIRLDKLNYKLKDMGEDYGTAA